jgi:hypothetical protein
MKKSLSFLFFVAVYFSAKAQAEISTVSFNKVDRTAIVNEMPFPEKTIMKAIDNKLELMGYKGKDARGFTVYKSVRMPELGNGEYDLYYMAERKSRRNKDNSTLTLMISKGNENFAIAGKDAKLLANGKTHLDSILPMITAFDLELQIADQEGEVKKADKKYNNLIDDGQSLEKKRKSIEQDIEDNKKDQEKYAAELEKQKLMLETLKAGRKQ